MVVCESFGPLAPILTVRNLADALEVANSTAFGLEKLGRCHDEFARARLRRIERCGAGLVNINEVPGFRIESSPFGGIKDSGMGMKEGVIESLMKGFKLSVKTFSLLW